MATIAANVERRFEYAYKYADEMRGQVAGYLASLLDFATSTSNAPALANPPDISFTQDFTQVEVDLPELPQAPENPYALPESPVIIARPEMPTIDSYILPDSPSIQALPELPSVPNIEELIFNEILTPITMEVPSVNIVAELTTYTSDLETAVRDRLRDNILNGGTGLSPAVETAIFDRGSEREVLALQDTIDKFTDQWAKRGFSLPDGVLAEGLAGIHLEYMNKNLDRSREIEIKQAELEQNNTTKSLSDSVQLESVCIGVANDGANRMFQASKAVADAGVEVFKSKVAYYNIKLDEYKVKLEAFKTRLQSQLTKIGIYKAQIEGIAAINGINDSRVKLYVAQIGAIQQLIDKYKTEVQAIEVAMGVDKLNIENFKVQVEAYVASVKGVTDIYQGNIDAYKGGVTAWASAQDVNVKLIAADVQLQLGEKELALKEWEATIKDWEIQVGIRAEAIKAAAQVAAQVASGALAGATASASEDTRDSYDMTKAVQTTSLNISKTVA